MCSNDIWQRISQQVESNRQQIGQTLQDLVQIPTLTGQEAEGQKYMEKLYSDIGIEVVSFEPDRAKLSKHPGFIESGLSFTGRPNVVGILKGNKPGNSVALNGHIDVVSPEPVTEWTSSPWEGNIIGNKLYGRGACDMKAGLLANYFAVKTLLDIGENPNGTVILQSVIEEEAGGNGTLACLLEGYIGDGLIITEPGTRLVLAHPGVNYFRIRVKGKPIHSAISHLGINAIGKMNLIYDALVELDKKRGKDQHYALFEEHSGRSCTLNMGTYHAGDWAGTVAGWAEIQCRISHTPREKFQEVKNEVERTIQAVSLHDDWLSQNPPLVVWYGVCMDAWEQDPNHPFVRTFKSCAEKVMGTKVDISGVPWGTDNRLSKYFGIPSLSFGPNGGNLHGIDEWVDLDSVIACIKVLALFLKELNLTPFK